VAVSGNASYDSGGFKPTQAGTYRWIASYSGDPSNAAASTACDEGSESVTVFPNSPTMSTNASPGVAIGSAVHDTATLSGGRDPGGTITFRLYGANDSDCSGTPAFTDTKTVSADGDYTSAHFSPTQAGVYGWRAAYSGDSNNKPVAGACHAIDETVSVFPTSLAVSTNASPDVALGASVHDTATLSGGQGPTGTITFKLYGPNESDCSGARAFTDVVSVSGGDAYASAHFTPTEAGTYRWTASYSGDSNNVAAATACDEGGGSVTVSKPSPGAPTTKIFKAKVTPRRHLAKFGFRGEGGSPPYRFQCRLDRSRRHKATKPFRPCSSPKLYKRLKAGRYTFEVRAIDASGAADPTPAKRSFRIA
jgi:hypothetical protein